jgi:hypothetical protein
MNFKTTLVLLVLVAMGAAVWFAPTLIPRLAPATSQPSIESSQGLPIVLRDLTADQIQRVRIQHGNREIDLKKAKNGDWMLPGDWPARKKEVDELLNLFIHLQSRFAPIAIGSDPDLTAYGLSKPAVAATINAGSEEHRLSFAEESGDANRFSRPTYARVDDRMEVIRLAPGIVAALDRPPDYYQQRRLFPSERVAKEIDSPERVERLRATAIAAKDKTANYTLENSGDDWQLRQPVQDHVDPDKLKTILSAIPDIWADQFIEKPKTDLAEYGLKDPEETLSVTGAGGQKITLLVGRQSQTKTRKVTRPAPDMGGPPMPPQQEVIHEEYRFAKLDGNPQIFEIKADKLKDIVVTTDNIRDARLTRFRTEDARAVDVTQGDATIHLQKDKDRWKLQKPIETDAEASKVTELLDKLSLLQARDKDILDKADAKAYGLDKPAAIVKVTTAEETKGDAKTKKTKTYTFEIGKRDSEHSKVYVRLEGLPRINAVEDSVVKLVERPALAYRGRRVLDYASTDLAKIEIKREPGSFTVEQVSGTWGLAAPVKAELDSSKVSQLAGELARLEIVEFASEMATPDALDRLYGLAKPAISATMIFTDAKKPAQTLQIGKRRESKPEYFAKLTSAPGVFVVKKELRDALDQDSLALRPLQLWQMADQDIREVKITLARSASENATTTRRASEETSKNGSEYRLKRDGDKWTLTGPFEAVAVPEMAKPIVDELSNLRCEKYVAHQAKDLAAYGLDKPYLRVALREVEKEKPAAAKDKKEPAKPAEKERTLLIGKPTDQNAKTRFAKLGDSDAVFVVGEKPVTAVDHKALDFLDRNLLALDSTKIEKIHGEGEGGKLTLVRQGNEWRVLDSPAPPFAADRQVVSAVVGIWSKLQASRYAAYGTKTDVAVYGLDKPSAMLRLTLKSTTGEAKPVEHTLLLGRRADGGGRFARLDNGPGVAVLPSIAVSELTRGYLDFVNHSVLTLDSTKVSAIERRMGNDGIDLVRRDAAWRLTKPADLAADSPTLDRLVSQLATLRAKRVAAYPAKEVKPYGLDAPEAVITIRLGDSTAKPAEHIIKIGHVADPSGKESSRFAQVDNADAAIVLPDSLTHDLMAPPLYFRDRTIARLSEVDRVALERGNRKATFSKVDSTWKLTQPIERDAEQFDLEDFIKAMSPLRADELVAEKPADLKPFGLDRPLLRWRFRAGDRELLDLVVGGLEKKDGNRRYAKLANGDVVFLLSPNLTAKMVGEYRSRSLWASLDATQIEKLCYGFTDHPFVLEKVENDWRVSGKAGAKVKPDIIREVLDALAGLKTSRYVLDKGADFKLFGLEPPQCVLEIQTSSGKRILHVGRPEGESKRIYARVPEGDKSDAVFIISETDAGRIVRPLAAFAQEPTKVSARR